MRHRRRKSNNHMTRMSENELVKITKQHKPNVETPEENHLKDAIIAGHLYLKKTETEASWYTAKAQNSMSSLLLDIEFLFTVGVQCITKIPIKKILSTYYWDKFVLKSPPPGRKASNQNFFQFLFRKIFLQQADIVNELNERDISLCIPQLFHS